MIVKIDREPVIEYMEELCGNLLSQESFMELKKMIDEFSGDEEAIKQYDHFREIQQLLHEKEVREIEFSEEETAKYNEAEFALYENDIIRQFLFAQREFSDVFSIAHNFLTKTIELGRLPNKGEIKIGGCGCGGSCGGS